MRAHRFPWFLHPATTTDGAPHIRGWWSTGRMTAALLLALAPLFVAAATATGGEFLLVFGVCLAVVFGWQYLFAALRQTRVDADGIATAAVFALMFPAAAPLWQVVLGVSFGVVIGEQIFGGRGRNILNPVVVGLAFLIFSFPAGGYDAAGAATAWMSLPGAALLLIAGLISWRIVVAAVAGLAISAALIGGANPVDEVVLGGFVFGVIFLACDPVCAAATNPARWLYGLLVGFLVFLGRTGSDGTADGIVFAVLVAMIFAPLADHAVIAANARWRRRRYG
ncbi:MAG: RnfABCDGE type electron transport complex subunit D [Alphaproteobacteria bacterium]